MAREFVSTLLASIGKRLEQHEFLAVSPGEVLYSRY